ncbi:MAG: hypothetical protein ACLFTI_03070 [Anaerolineales bacterium]
MSIDTLGEVRTLVHRLSYREKMRLLSDLATDLFRESVTESVAPDAFPVLHLNRWPEDLPLRRSELYNEYGR